MGGPWVHWEDDSARRSRSGSFFSNKGTGARTRAEELWLHRDKDFASPPDPFFTFLFFVKAGIPARKESRKQEN